MSNTDLRELGAIGAEASANEMSAIKSGFRVYKDSDD